MPEGGVMHRGGEETGRATVRDVCMATFRSLGLTRIFANPGSTEVPLLMDLPDDFEFVLALHESSVVGMATGFALATAAPALVLLHTTAGLGNAVGALATAREMSTPLVVLVGQQDRRHLVSEPFLAGRLELLAGDYPVWTATPPRAADLPDVVRRAYNEAVIRRGPAVVIAPMDDWHAELDGGLRPASPLEVLAAAELPLLVAARISADLMAADRPAIVSGSGAADDRSWAALDRIAGKLDAPVWQEAFGARPGFRQDSSRFAGLLAADRAQLRNQLRDNDLVLVVGAQSIRQYQYEPGPLFGEATKVIVIASQVVKGTVSTADLAVIADIAPALEAVDHALPGHGPKSATRPLAVPEATCALTPQQVFAALGARVAPDTAVFEESPSSRDDMSRYLPARSPWGFVSAAMGGLGFALPAAVGMAMAEPRRPVIAVLGDGSSLYSIHALWSAAQYQIGLLVIILANGGYAIMDRLAHAAGGKAPWPGLADIAFDRLAEGFGVVARRVSTRQALHEALDALVPTLRERAEPIVLVLDVAVHQEHRP